MQQFNDFFLTITFASLLICIILLLPQRKRSEQIKVFLILLLCCGSFILGQISFLDYSPVFIANFLGGNLLPGMFWLVCMSVFADKQKLLLTDYLIASTTLAAPTIKLLLTNAFNFHALDFVLAYVGVFLELAAILTGLFYCIKNIDLDLVAQRRSFRTTMILAVGVYLFSFIILGELFKVSSPLLTLSLNIIAACLSMYIVWVLFGLRHPSPFDIGKVVVNKNNSPLLTRIIDAMEKDKLYKQEGLTIANLAKRISIHEYKLRQLINGELDFRNFNDFLNHYRIREITHLLQQHEYANTPVLTLALENGFRSLSSFNKAFKDMHGKTPTQFKKELYG